MSKVKTKKIKDDEIAKLASKFQQRFGPEMAACWNSRLKEKGIPPIYDAGDFRAWYASIIKEWVEEIGRNED